MEKTRVQTAFYIILLSVILLLNFLVLRPYLPVLILATVLAVVFYPVYKKILKQFKKEGIAALLTTLLVLIIVLIPLTFWGQKILSEAQHLYSSVGGDQGHNTFVNGFMQRFDSRFNISGVSQELNQYLKNSVSNLLQNFTGIFSSAVRLIIMFFLLLVSLFFLLKDGLRTREAAIKIIPLPEQANEKILDKTGVAINSIIRGQLAVTFCQTILTIIGFTFFGIPDPVFWGSTVLLAALVPSLGTSLVLGPGIIYLYLIGHTGAALGLLAWAVLAVGLVDNFLGPYLMNKGIKIHSFVVLLSILGGVSAFGPIGFLLGPLFMTLLFAIYEARDLLNIN